MTYKVVCICGSMRYFSEMLDHARALTRNRCIVLMPFDGAYQGCKPDDDIKKMLDDMHLVKISMANEVHVIGWWIGESTSREIRFAEGNFICVRYFRPHLGRLAEWDGPSDRDDVTTDARAKLTRLTAESQG